MVPSIERLFEIGLNELRKQRYTFAYDAFLEAMELGPNLPEVYYNLGVVAGHLFRWEEAEGYFKMALRTYLNPNPDCYIHLALIYLRQREWADAREALVKTLKLDAADELARLHLEDLDRFLALSAEEQNQAHPRLCEGWYDERLKDYAGIDPDIVIKKEREPLREFIFEAMGKPEQPQEECDGSHELVEEWALRQGRDPLGVSRFLFERGMKCDCQVLREPLLKMGQQELIVPELPKASEL